MATEIPNPDRTPTKEDLDAAHRRAAAALLHEIARRSQTAGPATGVLNLAEAYAWLERPDQPHGSHTLGARGQGAFGAPSP